MVVLSSIQPHFCVNSDLVTLISHLSFAVPRRQAYSGIVTFYLALDLDFYLKMFRLLGVVVSWHKMDFQPEQQVKYLSAQMNTASERHNIRLPGQQFIDE